MARRCRVVVPSSRRLPLTEDYWIEVKDRLNVGERNEARAIAINVTPNGVLVPDLKVAGLAEIAAHLVDWNITDPGHKVIDIDGVTLSDRLAALGRLDQDTMDEIEAAFARHEEAMKAAREAEKNSQDGEKTDAEISPSVA